MVAQSILQLLILAASVAATPLFARTTSSTTNKLATIEIHESCNATEVRQLRKGLADAYELVTVARDYVLEKGHEDAVYRTYFGNAEPFAVIGFFESLASADKTGILFRCDNIDGNCANEGWAGHWRGENATSETVICPLSFEVRKYNEQFCALGYTVASHNPSYMFSNDLIHRFSHIPQVSHGLVDHYADTYEECLELAEHNATYAPFNTHSLQYFAADVYARVVAIPGEGCTGELEHHDHDHDETVSSSVPTATTSSIASTTASAVQECHTHADGDVHCT